ncbi:ribosomal protein S18-alanine N-acetyltransferase [Mycoplasmatota bacterium WC44]
MLIRKMFLEDIDTVVDQELEVFGSTLGTKMLNYELKENRYAHYFVMEDDEENIIGYIGLWCVFEKGQITNFYILPDYRGKKFGEKFLDYAMDYAKENGVQQLTLEVRESNKVAINLYQKHGFFVGGVRQKYYEDGENALLMVKEIR